MNHDFKDFIEGSETVPEKRFQETLSYIQVSMVSKGLLVKFYILNLTGALLTLFVCPQYGIGPFGGELGIVNNIMNMGPVWCGLFCGAAFFTGGNLLSFLFLKKAERSWLFNHKYGVIIPYIALVFVVGMFVKNLNLGHFHHDTPTFHMSWLVGGFAITIIYFVRDSLKSGQGTLP